jgi:hypothetical protein
MLRLWSLSQYLRPIAQTALPYRRFRALQRMSGLTAISMDAWPADAAARITDDSPVGTQYEHMLLVRVPVWNTGISQLIVS